VKKRTPKHLVRSFDIFNSILIEYMQQIFEKTKEIELVFKAHHMT
jgi:hypothetical protein